MNSSIIFWAAIALAAVYTGIVQIAAKGQRWAWWHRLVSTIVSVLLGIVIAMHIYSLQQNDQREGQKRRILYLLNAELLDTYRVLTSTNDFAIITNNDRFSAQVGFIQPLITEEAVKSGLFDQFLTEQLIHLARKMRFYNVCVDNVIRVANSFSGDPNYERRVRHATMNSELNRNTLIEDVETIRKNIGLPPAINVPNKSVEGTAPR
jgi:hypothetical protein